MFFKVTQKKETIIYLILCEILAYLKWKWKTSVLLDHHLFLVHQQAVAIIVCHGTRPPKCPSFRRTVWSFDQIRTVPLFDLIHIFTFINLLYCSEKHLFWLKLVYLSYIYLSTFLIYHLYFELSFLQSIDKQVPPINV